MVTVAILTVIVGSNGVLTIGGRASVSQGVDIVLTLCNIALAVAAALTATLSWRAKAVAYQRRSEEYTALAVQMQVDMNQVDQLPGPKTYMQTVMARIKALERMADPLPLRYRRDTDIRRGIISAWASWDLSSHMQQNSFLDAATAGPGGPSRLGALGSNGPHRLPGPRGRRSVSAETTTMGSEVRIGMGMGSSQGQSQGHGQGHGHGAAVGAARTRRVPMFEDGRTLEGCVGEFKNMVYSL
jgi:hypothetical protein